MPQSSSNARFDPKVHYRPIEAAIRWCGLLRFESRILRIIGSKPLPDPTNFRRWPQLRLNTERIFDALVNGDLPYGKEGITCEDPSLLHSAELTIRHVDLKAWMAHFYPDQKPPFLFDAVERQVHHAITTESVLALVACKEAINTQLAERTNALESLQTQHELLMREQAIRVTQDTPPDPRSEATYLNIIGGLLTLLLGKSPSGVPYSTFRNMESVINGLVAHHSDRSGISERTLWTKLGEAKRRLQA